MVFQSTKATPARTAADDTRETIVAAADRLFPRFGYQKTTVDDIAREAGIGKGTIYLHFKSKEEVAFACLDRMKDRLMDSLRAVLRRCASPEERVRHMLLTRVLFRFDAAQGWFGAMDELYAVLRPELLERREIYHEREAEVIAEALVEGRVLGVFDVEDAMVAARSLVLATDALLPYSLSARQLGERNEIEAKANGIADILLHGLIARAQIPGT